MFLRSSCLLLAVCTGITVQAEPVEGGRVKRSDDPERLQGVVDGLSQQLSLLIARFTSLQSKYTALENRLDAAQKTVAFHAYHSTDPFSVASHGTIVYDAVTTNVGNAYDKQAGIFTAPVAGTYVFFINCMSVDATSEESYILVDGASVASCYSSKPRTLTTEQGGTLTTVHLTAGQKVWVQILQNAENVRGYRWNTFSGFLVRADV